MGVYPSVQDVVAVACLSDDMEYDSEESGHESEEVLATLHATPWDEDSEGSDVVYVEAHALEV